MQTSYDRFEEDVDVADEFAEEERFEEDGFEEEDAFEEDALEEDVFEEDIDTYEEDVDALEEESAEGFETEDVGDEIVGGLLRGALGGIFGGSQADAMDAFADSAADEMLSAEDVDEFAPVLG